MCLESIYTYLKVTDSRILHTCIHLEWFCPVSIKVLYMCACVYALSATGQRHVLPPFRYFCYIQICYINAVVTVSSVLPQGVSIWLKNRWAIKGRIDYQVRDMAAFVLIHCCIGNHIKITIQGLYLNLLPYCDHNTDSPFFFIISLITFR